MSNARRQTPHIFYRRGIALALACAMPAAGIAQPSPPQPVSPGAASAGTRVEARCPTFSWAGVEGAVGYELAVFRVSVSPGVEPELVTRATLPAQAQSWTPPLGQCLERGERYAWSVAAASADVGRAPADARATLDWAREYLFEVDAAPPGEEVRRALATLRGCLSDASCAGELGVEAAELGAPANPHPVLQPADAQAGAGSSGQRLDARSPRRHVDERYPTGVERDTVNRHHESRGVTRVGAAAMAPTLGIPSLRVGANIVLGPASNVFRDGYPFLWGDGTEGNTALGRNALTSVSGHTLSNTAIGRYALQNTDAGSATPNSLADDNTAVGDEALRFNTDGWSNTAVGASALKSNFAAAHNTAVGADALRANLVDSHNTAVGSGALFISNGGSRNTAVGASAMFYTTTGDRNVASGFEALHLNTSGSNNAAVGVEALRANTSGHSNSAVGAYALRANTIGVHNTAHGKDTLRLNTDGFNNTAVGSEALQSNTTGDENSAAGRYALRDNSTGTANTAFGSWALVESTSGNGNTALGHDALFNNTSGSRNLALGYQAGLNSTTGSDNILISNTGVAGEGHALRIGQTTHNIGVGAIDKAYIHGIWNRAPGPDAANVQIGSDGKLGIAASTRRVKQDIADLDRSLIDRLLALRPVAFRYRERAAADPDAPPEYGLIAEEVAEVFPELVIRDSDGRPLTVRYHLLDALLLAELQRLHERVEDLEPKAR